MTHVLLQAAETVHHGKELPFAPISYGVIALAIGLSLLGLLWSFRSSLALDPVEHHHDDIAGDDIAGERPHGTKGSHH